MLNWQDKISLKGNYDIEAKDLNSVALLQKIDLAEFNPYFTGLNIKNGSIKKAELVVRGKDPYVIKGNAKIQDLATFYPFGNLDASKAITLRGNANLDTEITIIKDKVSYRIGGSLLKAELANLPFINTLANVNANFKLDSTKLECSYIAADLPVTKQNSAIHFTAKGELNLQTLQ
jgi:hypothetical protein